MCGLGITLGRREPPVPKAAHLLATAILSDLEGVDEKGKKEAMGTPDEAEAIGGKKKTTKGSSTMEDEVETERWPSVEEGWIGNDNVMLAVNSLRDEWSQPSGCDDAFVFQAVSAKENGEASICTELRWYNPLILHQ